MKKFINQPQTFVSDALAGFALAHADLVSVDMEHRLVCRATPKLGKVGLVSGGGSGHEPLHSGFVGHGMLDVACIGEIFTSPVPHQILLASQLAHTGSGVLHIIKNYTGDRLAFRLGLDLAQDSQIPIESVVIADDCAIDDSVNHAGRRGTGATVLVQRIAGAKAELGADLQTVAQIARKVAGQARSFGVALESCTNPNFGSPIFQLGHNEIELGVGIHGEPGRRRSPMAPARELVQIILSPILEDLKLRAGTGVLLLVNGLGGTPLGELYGLIYEAQRQLSEQRIEVQRSMVGSFVTSLDMAGASLTVLVLDEELSALWDAPIHTAAFRWRM